MRTGPPRASLARMPAAADRPRPAGSPQRPREPEPPIRISGPGQLIAAIPALIGYHPPDSLVLIGTGGRSGFRIGLVVRVDLPKLRHAVPVVTDAVGCLLADRPVGAAVLLLGPAPGGTGRSPHARLASLVVAALEDVGIHPRPVAWAERVATGARWACVGGECGCAGLLPDPASTVLAAAVVAGGQVIHADRAELERTVAVADPERVARRRRLLAETGPGPGPGRAPMAVVTAAIDAAGTGRVELDDVTVLGLARALREHRVRDAALLQGLGPSASAAERLWTLLVRELPDPDAAEPAALLAVSALLRGDGAMANVALDRAEQSRPGHRLAGLLRRVADAGVRPAQLRSWLAGMSDGAASGGPGR